MIKSTLNPVNFLNINSIELLAKKILSDAQIVWDTEIWLDPIEKSKLKGEELSKTQEELVARELLNAGSHLNNMLASTIDLYQLCDKAGYVANSYDKAYKYLVTRENDSLNVGAIFKEAETFLPDFLHDRGFSKDAFSSLMESAKNVGISFDNLAFLGKKGEVFLTGGELHQISKVKLKNFPNVAGDVFINQGLLKSYDFGIDKDEHCVTDTYQTLLALSKYAGEAYEDRIRLALHSGLQPYKTGVAPVVVLIVLLIIAFVAAVALGIACSLKKVDAQVCNTGLAILGFIMTIIVCGILAPPPTVPRIPGSTDNTFSCTLNDGGGTDG
jgi:hypothetical protein